MDIGQRSPVGHYDSRITNYGLHLLELSGRQRSMMQGSGATRIDEVVFDFSHLAYK